MPWPEEQFLSSDIEILLAAGARRIHREERSTIVREPPKGQTNATLTEGKRRIEREPDLAGKPGWAWWQPFRYRVLCPVYEIAQSRLTPRPLPSWCPLP